MKGEIQMRCPECGFEIAENDVFCGSCGAEILTDTEIAPSGKSETEEPEKKKSKKKKKKNPAGNSGNKRKLALIIAAAVVIIAVIVIIIVCIVIAVKASKGRKLFDKVPLGRDITMIEATTEEIFERGESSVYGALNHIADYNYICEAEKNVDVDGIKLPEWAVLLNEDYSGNINKATFYNFSILKHSWMGEGMASKIESSAIEYGMKIRTAERTLGMKPYTIVKENDGNTSTYAYRYHYTDEDSGNTCVMNFYVVADDSNGQVKYVYDEQLDYLNLILKGTSKGSLL